MRRLDGPRLELNARNVRLRLSDDGAGTFVSGAPHRGASLIVWTIAEGRSAALAVDASLVGEFDLRKPVTGALPSAVV